MTGWVVRLNCVGRGGTLQTSEELHHFSRTVKKKYRSRI